MTACQFCCVPMRDKVQHVAAVCDPSVSILDLRNGMGENNSEGIFSNSQIVDRSDDSERVFQGKGHIYTQGYPRWSSCTLLAKLSNTNIWRSIGEVADSTQN